MHAIIIVFHACFFPALGKDLIFDLMEILHGASVKELHRGYNIIASHVYGYNNSCPELYTEYSYK